MPYAQWLLLNGVVLDHKKPDYKRLMGTIDEKAAAAILQARDEWERDL